MAQSRRTKAAETPGTAALEKPRMPLPLKLLWLDNEADIHSLTSRDFIAQMLDKAKDAGFNVIVPDTKNYMGFVFFDSAIASRPKEVRGKPYPQDFDFLKVIVEEAHKRGMQVHPGLNLFAEGGKGIHGKVGPAYDHPDWEAIVYDYIPELAIGTRFTTTVRTLNDRGDSGFSVFTPAYGRQLHRKDAPENVTDHVKGKAASRWVSNNPDTTPTLEFCWQAPNKLAGVGIHFSKGFPVRAVKVSAAGAEIGSTSGNSALEVFIPLAADPATTSAAGVAASKIRIEFTDSGADRIARVEEVEVFDTNGINIAPDAAVTADSSMMRGRGRFLSIANGRILGVTGEAGFTTAGIEIPAGGFVIVAEDAATAGFLPAFEAGTSATVTVRKALVPESEYPGGTLVYVNPANPDVQKHNLDIIDEILTKYDVDGVILDRARFDNFKVDFSNLSRRRFEAEMKVRVKNWPDDIYIPANPLTGEGRRDGPLFDKWVLWRAKVIRSFIEKARDVVNRHPGRILGDYVGGWYSTYWEVGVNWAAEGYDPAGDYDWAPPGYKETGYAQLLDYLSPGVYYSAVRKSEAPAGTDSIESGIELVRKVTRGSVPLAVGLYVPNINSDAGFEDAVRLCIEQGGGVMIFSHTSLEKSNRWDAARRGMEATPQHLE